jgi:hypothetical protein
MITIRSDSVGGHPCLIFYRGERAVWTYWGWMGYPFSPLSVELPDSAMDDFKSFCETLTALGGLTTAQKIQALETFLKGD